MYFIEFPKKTIWLLRKMMVKDNYVCWRLNFRTIVIELSCSQLETSTQKLLFRRTVRVQLYLKYIFCSYHYHYQLVYQWERSSCDRCKCAFHELVINTEEPTSGTGVVLTGHGAAVDMGQLRGHRHSQDLNIVTIFLTLGATQRNVIYLSAHQAADRTKV